MLKFWKKKPKEVEASKAKVQKLPKPKNIPEPVVRYLVVELGKDPDWVCRLKSVVRPRQGRKDSYDVRVFDEVKTTQMNVMVKHYTSLDDHPELILYEGWFRKKSTTVQIKEKEIQPMPRAA